MAFLLYFVVILVTAASVMFGIDLATSPLPSTPNVPLGRSTQVAPSPGKSASKQPRRVAKRELSPIYPASPQPPKPQAQAVQQQTSGAGDAAPKQASDDAWLPPQQQQAAAPANRRASAPAQPDQQAATAAAPAAPSASPQPAVAAGSAPQCDLQACAAAYHSFRASDCSYQPYEGARRLCTRSGGITTAAAQPRRLHPAAGWRTRQAGNGHELDEVTRIVRKMTRGENGDVAVQDSQGRIIVVHPGRARAYSPFDDDNGD